MVFAMALWGSSFIALKIAFAEYAPMFVIFARMLIATLCFMFVLRRVFRFNYHRGDWRWLLLMSACEPCLYFVFEAQALQHTSASQAGMIVSTLPLIVAVLAYFWIGERPRRAQWLGFAVAICGVAGLSLLSEQSAQAPNPLLGNLLQVAAMLCAAVYSVSLKRLSVRYSAFSLTALQAAVGSLFFAPFLLFVPLPDAIHWPALLATVYLGACVTLGAYLLYNYAISRIDVSMAAAYSNLIPVFTLLFAYWLLGEQLSGNQWLAAAVVVSGVLISQLRRS